MDLKNAYNKIINNWTGNPKTQIIQRWKPIISNKMNIKIDNDFIYDKISVFCEAYSCINVQKVLLSPLDREPKFPKDYFELHKALEFIVEELNYFIVDNEHTMLNIVGEYYNVLTGNKGLLLDNNVRIENGKVLNTKHQKKINKEIEKNIDNSIEFILNPEIRVKMLRSKKIDRIIDK